MTMETQILSKIVFDDVLFGTIFQKNKISEKPLPRIEFEWNSDGTIRAVHRFLTCPICGSEFKPSRKGHRFCSRRCQQRACYLKRKPKLPIILLCPGCGMGFKPTHRRQKYCSPKCSWHYWYITNKDRKLKNNKNWRARNPAKVYEYNHRRYLRLKKTRMASNKPWEPGTGLNLNIVEINGQKRVVEAVRLERRIQRWKSYPFRRHKERVNL